MNRRGKRELPRKAVLRMLNEEVLEKIAQAERRVKELEAEICKLRNGSEILQGGRRSDSAQSSDGPAPAEDA
jgi:hypothetical protein